MALNHEGLQLFFPGLNETKTQTLARVLLFAGTFEKSHKAHATCSTLLCPK